MSDKQTFTHVSFQRAFESVVQSLSVTRESEDSVPRSLDEALLKILLVESFAHQFEDDTTILEKRVREILEKQIRQYGSSEAFE